MITDPISWLEVTYQLREWASRECFCLTIPDVTDSLFQERSLPIHKSRCRLPREVSCSQVVYSFFEPFSKIRGLGPNIYPNLSPQSNKLLLKINRFDRSLLLLGILPNQLRSLAKEHKMKHIDDSLMLLSDTLFWEGYEVWKKRKFLVKNFWQKIAPNEWKFGLKDLKSKSKSKSKSKRKMQTGCNDPFHFCIKISDLSKKRRTICACSDTIQRQVDPGNADIRYFLTNFPRPISSVPKSSLSSLSSLSSPKNFSALTRDDLVRKQHDRGEKKKKRKE